MFLVPNNYLFHVKINYNAGKDKKKITDISNGFVTSHR